MYIRVFDKRTDTEKESNHGHEKNESFVYQVVLIKYHNTWQNISQIEWWRYWCKRWKDSRMYTHEQHISNISMCDCENIHKVILCWRE